MTFYILQKNKFSFEKKKSCPEENRKQRIVKSCCLVLKKNKALFGAYKNRFYSEN